MPNLSGLHLFLVGMGGAIMFYILLKAIGQSAMVVASGEIEARRAAIARQRAEDAAAEAAGRAAALEPLALNADGSVEEPLVAMVEVPA
jgi:NAD/NADP transhydrogenase beta subunit